MSAISDYNAACVAAQSAIEAGQYATAVRKFEVAMAALLRIPDSELESEKLTFPRSQIEKMVEYCRKRASENGETLRKSDGGMRFTDMEYQRG